MSVERIQLENFQSHKDTSLELSPGMNVIWGPTDNGKSSIIRGLRWVVLNRPQGDEFRRHDTKKTQVTLENDNFIVQRRRTDTKNVYEMDEEIFKALRTAVPEDISSALNLSEANIQSQHEVYFLIDKSPGQRSKILNEVAGLQIMDKVMKKTNSEIRDVNAEIKSNDKALKTTQECISNFDWITDADKFLTRLEKYEKEIEKKQDFHHKISVQIAAITVLEHMKSKMMSQECIKELNNLLKKEKELEDEAKFYGYLWKRITTIEKLEKRLDSITVFDLSELEFKADEIDFCSKKYIHIQDVIEEIEFKETQYKQLKSDRKKTENNILRELKRLGKCPTCGVTI